MTKQEMLDFFDLMLDKANSPYYTDDQKIQFINVAILEVAKDYLQNTYPQLGEGWMQHPQVVANYHRNKSIHAIMQPIEIKRIPVASSALGVVSFASIESEMVLMTGEAASLMMVTAIHGYRHIHQMSERIKNNTFLKPGTQNKYYEPSAGGFFLYPEAAVNVVVDAIKYPRMLTEVSSDPTDMPESVHAEIMSLALSYVGVSMSEQPSKQFKQ